MSRILLVEDNRDYARTLGANFEIEGYEVTIAENGVDGLEEASCRPPDLIILDLMLPAMSGFTVLQRLRDMGHHTPVLIMTARGAEEEKLRGFGLGADDYIVKPCGLREILARVRALLRRAGAAAPAKPVIELQDIAIDLGARTVRRSGNEIALRPREFDLLAALLRYRGRVVTRDELLREVWGYAPGTMSRTVETHLAALRDRLGGGDYIVTVRGRGYRID